MAGQWDISGGNDKAFNWSGGDWIGTALELTTIAPSGVTGGVLNISGTNTKEFDQRYIFNQGTINWSEGSLQTGHDGTLSNQVLGVINDTLNTNESLNEDSGANGYFDNLGSYLKTGSGTTTMEVTVSNFGQIQVDHGTLILAGSGSDGGGTFPTGSFLVKNDGLIEFADDFTITMAANLAASDLSHDYGYLHSGGTLTIDGDLGVAFEQTGGNLQGDLTIDDYFNWSSGNWKSDTAGRTITVSPDATLEINHDSNANYDNHTLVNQGTVDWIDGPLWTAGTGSIINETDGATYKGVFHDQHNDAAGLLFFGTSAVFDNQGDYLKTGTGQTAVLIDFNNSGLLDVSDGTLILSGGGTTDSGGTIDVSGTGTVRFSSSYTVASGAMLTSELLDGSHGFEQTGGTLTIDTTIDAYFSQSGGTLAGSPKIDGMFNWKDGDWNAVSGTPTTEIGTTGVLNITGNEVVHTFDGRAISNHGTINFEGGFLQSDATGSITNQSTGLFHDTQTNDGAMGSSPANAATFVNRGEYRKDAGGTTAISMEFTNEADANLNINLGALRLENGGVNHDGANVFIEEGAELEFTTNYSIENPSDISGTGTLRLTGGELSVDGTVAVDVLVDGGTLKGDVGIDGTLKVQSNGLAPTFSTTVNDYGSAAFEANEDVVLDDHDININEFGYVEWSQGPIKLTGGSIITNDGEFAIRGDDQLQPTTPGALGEFVNNGTLRKFDSTGTTRIDVPFTNSGNIDIESGNLELNAGGTFESTSDVIIGSAQSQPEQAELVLRDGSFSAVADSFSGNGILFVDGGDLSMSGDLGVELELSMGSLSATELNIEQHLLINGGSIVPGSMINLINEAQATLDATELSLSGSIVTVDSSSQLAWTGGSLFMGEAGLIIVEGLMTAESNDSIINDTTTFDGALSIGPDGQFRKIESDGLTTIEVPVYNLGRFEVHTGTVDIAGGGSSSGIFDVWNLGDPMPPAVIQFSDGFTFMDGTTFTNGGYVDLLGGAFTISDEVNLGPDAYIAGGTFDGTHELSGNIFYEDGFFLPGGTTTITADASLRLFPLTGIQLQRTFINEGLVEWNEGDLEGSDATFTNRGSFLVSSEGTFDVATETSYEFTNEGSFGKVDGSGTSTIDIPFVNNGVVFAESGTLHFADDFSGDGIIGLDGGVVSFTAPLALSSDSTLSGNGTINANITTGGRVAPGASVGQLTINGDLTLLSTSESLFEVDMAASPSQNDFVDLTGDLTLAGTLVLDLISSSIPVSTDVFTLYSANSLVGAFSNAPNGTRLYEQGLQGSFLVNYDSTSVFLSDFEFAPIPEPSTWALMIIGSGLLGWQLRARRRRP